MTPRALLASLAIVFIIVGAILGFAPRGGSDAGCGSVLRPDTLQAQFADTLRGSFGGYEAACDKALSDGRPLTYGALGLGGVAGLLAIAIWGTGASTTRKESEPRQA